MTTGTYLVSVDVPRSDHRDRFVEWYEDHCIPAVVGVPGVIGVSRWRTTDTMVANEAGSLYAVPGTPAYNVVYDLDDVDVVRSNAFLDAVGRSFARDVVIDGSTIEFELLASVTLADIGRRTNPGAEGVMPRGMLVVSLTPERAYTETFHEWYESVHLNELLACPGFLGTRRMRALDGVLNYFALYYVETVDTLYSDAYKAVSGRPFADLPPLHQQIGPHMTGTICDYWELLD